MCRWLALVLLHEVSALEQAPSVAPAPVLDPSLLAQQLAEKPEPPTFLASATASDTREADEAESPSTTVNGEEARLRDKITQEVEDKIREHAKRKHEQEEESEQAESDSTFLIFVVLGLAAIARFLCKGRVQREHSGYFVITDTSPTKKRETAAQFWTTKRTQSLDSAHSGDKPNGSSNGLPSLPSSPPLRSDRSGSRHAEGKGGGLASVLSSKK